jgi:hypothetical protein
MIPRLIPRWIPRFCSFIAAFLYFAVAVPAGAAVPSLAAKPISKEIVLDGILNDPLERLPAASGFHAA